MRKGPAARASVTDVQGNHAAGVVPDAIIYNALISAWQAASTSLTGFPGNVAHGVVSNAIT